MSPTTFHLIQPAKTALGVCGCYQDALIPHRLYQHPLCVLRKMLCELHPACTDSPLHQLQSPI